MSNDVENNTVLYTHLDEEFSLWIHIGNISLDKVKRFKGSEF